MQGVHAKRQIFCFVFIINYYITGNHLTGKCDAGPFVSTSKISVMLISLDHAIVELYIKVFREKNASQMADDEKTFMFLTQLATP